MNLVNQVYRQIHLHQIQEGDIPQEDFPDIWKFNCTKIHDEHEEDVDSNIGISLFNEILRRTTKTKLLNEYKKHTEILKEHFVEGLYRTLIERIKFRRDEMSNSVDFLKD
jgi:hypothetical protein